MRNIETKTDLTIKNMLQKSLCSHENLCLHENLSRKMHDLRKTNDHTKTKVGNKI